MKIRIANINDAESIATLHLDSWRITYKDIVPADYLAALSYKTHTKMWQQILSSPANTIKQITFVAENNEHEMMGFISGGINRDENFFFEAELYAV